MEKINATFTHLRAFTCNYKTIELTVLYNYTIISADMIEGLIQMYGQSILNSNFDGFVVMERRQLNKLRDK